MSIPEAYAFNAAHEAFLVARKGLEDRKIDIAIAERQNGDVGAAKAAELAYLTAVWAPAYNARKLAAKELIEGAGADFDTLKAAL